MRFIKENRYKLLVTALVFLFLGMTLVLGLVFPSLKAFEIVPIALLCGIGYASFLKNVIPIKNILVFLGVATFLGLFLNTFLIFLLGTLGVSLSSVFFLIYIVLTGLLNMYLFFRFSSEEDILGYVKKIKFEVVDIVAILIFVALFFMFASECLESYFAPWDVFTFWGVDAKYIFENSRLRDGSFGVLANNYLSFFSLQINYVYLLYGRIVEEFTGLLSLIYGYTALTIVLGYVVDIKKSLLKKIFLYLGLFSALYAFYTVQKLLICMYSDVFLSAVVLTYCVVLFNKEFDERDWYKRALLLSLLAISLYLTKTHYFVFAIYLFIFPAILDLIQQRGIIKRKWKDWRSLLCILILFVVIILVARYLGIIDSRGESGFVASTFSHSVIGRETLVNFKNIVKGFLQNIPLVAVVTSLYIILAFLVNKGFSKDNLIKIAFLVIFVLPIIGVYTLGAYPIGDGSIYRYLGMVYFVLPFLFIDILPDFDIKDKWQESIAIIVIFSGIALLTLQLSFATKFNFSYSPVDGNYVNHISIKQYADLAAQVDELIPGNSSVLVLSYQFEAPNLTDFLEPGDYIRYFILHHVNNYPYACLSYDCVPIFKSIDPDYLIIYNYDNYWSECSNAFENGKSYLVKFDFKQEEFDKGGCFLSSDDVRLLSY